MVGRLLHIIGKHWKPQLAAVLIAVCAVTVWLAGSLSSRFFLADVVTGSQATLAVQSGALERLLDKFRLMTPLLARSPDAEMILVEGTSKTDAKVASFSAGMSGAEEVWFLDRNGSSIVSSSSGPDAVAALGSSAIPEAFEQALQGQLGREVLSGDGESPASYVFASGIRSGDELDGVVAVRVSLADVEQEWALSKDPIVAVDQAGVVLVSNVAAWRGRRLSGLIAERTEPAILDTLETETVKLVTVDGNPPGDTFARLETSLPVLGWDVLIFADTSGARAQSAKAMLIAVLLLVIVVGGLAILVERRSRLVRRMRDDKAAALRLERRVRSRTAALTRANTLLEQEVVDRQQAEEELRHTQAELVQAAKLATLGQMSAALSHEYNQPLAAIKTNAENAVQFIELGKTEVAAGNLVKIGGLADRMAEIARTLKGFTRKSGTDTRPVSLKQVVAEALVLLMPQLKQSGVELTKLIPEEDIIVEAGRIRLEQVIVNLVSNALDAVKDVINPKVMLSLEVVDERVVLRVTDNGPGIPDDVLPSIFDPFFTTKDVGAGLGLGLSIAYKIVHDFSGTLTAHNLDDGGAAFIMKLPIKAAQPAAAE